MGSMHEKILELDVGDQFKLTLADGSTVSAVVSDVEQTPNFYELGLDSNDGSRYILGVVKEDAPTVEFDEWDAEDETWKNVEPPKAVKLP